MKMSDTSGFLLAIMVMICDDSACVEDQWLPCKLGIKSDQTWLVSGFNSSISRGPSLAASTHR